MTKSRTVQSSVYETDKLNLAAYLITSKVSILERAYCPDGGQQVVFSLTPEPTQDQVAAFFSGQGQVSALAYNNTLSNLKAAVFEAKRN
ncbi:MAG: hypothetical protein KOO62_09145 [candidate division Zixibacteria bacterium]|nr:hypothetical protein [candidate division Zixibacteria bacterium]